MRRRFLDLIAEGESSVGKKYVYYFGDGKAEGTGNMKELLGGKGAGLAEMTNLEISVPPGFTISTEACVEYYKRGKAYPPGMMDEALHALKRVERSMAAGFGDADNPLLVSVRSGARASMPGMMDTVLNVGLTTKTVQGLAAKDPERALRAGQLSTFHFDVRQHRDGSQSRAFRRYSQAQETGSGRHARHASGCESVEGARGQF